MRAPVQFGLCAGQVKLEIPRSAGKTAALGMTP